MTSEKPKDIDYPTTTITASIGIGLWAPFHYSTSSSQFCSRCVSFGVLLIEFVALFMNQFSRLHPPPHPLHRVIFRTFIYCVISKGGGEENLEKPSAELNFIGFRDQQRVNIN